MKKIILTLSALLFSNFCFADEIPEGWTYLGKSGNENVYYWYEMGPSSENKNWFDARIVRNDSNSQESVGTQLLLDCTNKTIAATYQERYDYPFSEGEMLNDEVIERVFKPAEDEISQKLLSIVCKN